MANILLIFLGISILKLLQEKRNIVVNTHLFYHTQNVSQRWPIGRMRRTEKANNLKFVIFV